MPGTKPEKFYIHQNHIEQILEHIQLQLPEEACGIIGGIESEDGYLAKEVLPMVNILHSPVRFHLDPQEQWKVFNHLEKQGLILAGIFHSHPQGPDHPSPIDIAEAYYPESVNLIFFPEKKTWSFKGYLIIEKNIREIPVILIPHSNKKNATVKPI